MPVNQVYIEAGKDNGYPNQCVYGYIRNEDLGYNGSFLLIQTNGVTITKTLAPQQGFHFGGLYLKKVSNTGATTLAVYTSEQPFEVYEDPVQMAVGFNPNTELYLVYDITSTANMDILATSLTPNITPTQFQVTISLAVADQFILVRYNGNNTYTSTFNQGRYLIPNSEYTFTININNGDTINFQTLHNNTVNLLSVDEADSG